MTFITTADAVPETARQPPFRVLAFSKTAGYRHECIPVNIAALRALGDRTRLFTLDATEDAEILTPDTLAGYATVVFLHTTGPFLNEAQMAALQSYVRGGGGFVGVHAAASGNKEFEWYGRLVGAHFDYHPAPEEGTLVIEDTGHEIMSGNSGGERRWMDEWYNFKTHPRDNTNLHVLVRGDTSSFQGGNMGDDHPLVWCQEFEGGRSFYTALGHFDEAYEDEWFMGQLERAIVWTSGVGKMKADK
jgi:type 1 glutamine amidotransferase